MIDGQEMFAIHGDDNSVPDLRDEDLWLVFDLHVTGGDGARRDAARFRDDHGGRRLIDPRCNVAFTVRKDTCPAGKLAMIIFRMLRRNRENKANCLQRCTATDILEQALNDRLMTLFRRYRENGGSGAEAGEFWEHLPCTMNRRKYVPSQRRIADRFRGAIC
jgi:hypothetical protein